MCIVWFCALAALGLWHILGNPEVLLAFNPWFAVKFLAGAGTTGLFVLGAVFLTVTGAEALIADMGHFGRLPIQLGWLAFVLPALMINYLGQGAMALHALEAARAAGAPFKNADWFFLMAPEALRAPVVVLATLATIIASQAVITGAYSMTQQAIALGLLPRLTIRQTSAEQFGQIYMPVVNYLLLIGVVLLVLGFRSSSAMAAAYGIAVTGTMAITTALAFFIVWRSWNWPIARAIAFIVPFLLVDLVFFGANILRVAEGGWVPLSVAAAVAGVIATWIAGWRASMRRSGTQSVKIEEFATVLAQRPPQIVDGVAVFLTQHPESAPSALLHNLKHNKALHRQNILLSVDTSQAPHIPAEERLEVRRIDAHFVRAALTYGYMDRIDVPSDLARGNALMAVRGGTSFFVGRNAIKLASNPALPFGMTRLYSFLHRNAADPTAISAFPPTAWSNSARRSSCRMLALPTSALTRSRRLRHRDPCGRGGDGVRLCVPHAIRARIDCAALSPPGAADGGARRDRAQLWRRRGAP